MTGQITISIWLFLFLIAFAVWAILDRVLIPSTRWFLRRRINRVIDEIGHRLDIKIRRLVVESEGSYRAAPDEDDILTYYANSIVHWMPEKIA
jgi:hypothetical protein